MFVNKMKKSKKNTMRTSLKIRGRVRSKKHTLVVVLLLCSSLLINSTIRGQQDQPAEDTKLGAPKVYLECPACDIPAIQREIPFVTYVQSIEDAQVLVRISTRKTETGSTEYTLTFKGYNIFEGDDDLLTLVADKTDTPETITQRLVQMLKMALMRYVGKTPVSSRIDVRFLDVVKPTDVVDKWNFWVFSISGNSFLDGETSYKSGMYFGSISANRVTPELKIQASISLMHYTNSFTFEDQVIKSSSSSQSLHGLVVKSINDHWSIGAYFSAYTSTFSNIEISLSPAPAIEYDLFPYSESTEHQLRFLYRLGLNAVRYREETIYDKLSENLLRESLSVTLELKKPWGTVNTSLEGSHYFHDFGKNRLELYGGISLRLLKGLNFNIDGYYSRIRDQLALAKGVASLEEVLLRRRELATTYQYYVSVGLSYTFGSVESKVVNPRFGDGGGGISIQISM